MEEGAWQRGRDVGAWRGGSVGVCAAATSLPGRATNVRVDESGGESGDEVAEGCEVCRGASDDCGVRGKERWGWRGRCVDLI